MNLCIQLKVKSTRLAAQVNKILKIGVRFTETSRRLRKAGRALRPDRRRAPKSLAHR